MKGKVLSWNSQEIIGGEHNPVANFSAINFRIGWDIKKIT